MEDEMKESIKLKLKQFAINGVISESALRELELQLGYPLPQQYKDIMTEIDGGEGFVGDQYLILWRVNEIAEFNKEYEVSKYAPGLLLFGSSGGGEAFAFDTRDPKFPIVMVPFIGMRMEDAILVAGSFEEFLSALENGTFI